MIPAVLTGAAGLPSHHLPSRSIVSFCCCCSPFATVPALQRRCDPGRTVERLYGSGRTRRCPGKIGRGATWRRVCRSARPGEVCGVTRWRYV